MGNMLKKSLSVYDAWFGFYGDFKKGTFGLPYEHRRAKWVKIPSPELEFVCHEAELVFTQILTANNWKLPLQVGLNFYIGKVVLKNCFEKCP